MKKLLILFICLFSCVFSSAQLKTLNQVDPKVTISKVGSHVLLKDPKLGYILAVKGSTTFYLIELGKSKSEAKETIDDLITIGKNGIFVEGTIFGATMYIYGDLLTNNKPIVRFKDPKLHGSAYISLEQLIEFNNASF
jgi:hypothetical protein